MTTAKVYQAIAQVTHQMGVDGISKSRKNAAQGYNFRGIDDVYNALSSMLASAKLCILPCVLERQCDERQSAKGGILFYVTVKVRFDFVSAEDGSKHEVVTYGEAMDSGDKATNKAMSAAYKYAAMQAFCIPTEGDNDADAQTHQVAPSAKPLNMEQAVKDISGQNTLDSLKDVYMHYMRQASPSQQAELTDTKDARKAQLTPTKEAA